MTVLEEAYVPQMTWLGANLPFIMFDDQTK
jgi:hypothetical protein